MLSTAVRRGAAHFPRGSNLAGRPNGAPRPSPLRPPAVSQPRRRRPVAVPAVETDVATFNLDWGALEGIETIPGSWNLRPGQEPSTAPEPSLPTSADSKSSKRVMLYRDTNSWCPFCERILCALLEKGIDFDTVFISLGNKPEWYVDMVPTKMVPAAMIDGEVHYESAVILQKLEEAFPEPALLPADADLRVRATELIARADEYGGAGYRFLQGKDRRLADGEPQPSLAELQALFEAKLGELEEVLGQTEGPFFMPEFSMVDICYISSMQRISAHLAVYRNFSVKGNPAFPRVTEWLQAVGERESYNSVKTDDATHAQIVGQLFGMELPSPPPATESQLEAGRKLAANHEAVIRDILKNAGLMETESDFVRRAVGITVFNLASCLQGKGPAIRMKDVWEEKAEAKQAAAVSAASLAFLRCRVSSPRDMSASACEAFRAGIDELIRTVYW